MLGPSVLRVFAFEPSRPGLIDTVLRDVLLPEICGQPGIVDMYAGRQGPDELGERYIASVWQSAEVMDAAPRESTILGRELPDFEAGLEQARTFCLPIGIALRFEGPEPPRIIRVFRGEVREGELEDYLAEVRSGGLADRSANPGLVALYLGVESTTRFLTVSTWVDWDAIAAATGGNIERPISTAYPERIEAFDARHYEILPGTARPGVPKDMLAAAS